MNKQEWWIKCKAPSERNKLGRFVKGCVNPNKNGVLRNCKICNKTFYLQGFRINDIKRGKTCSLECGNQLKRGQRHSLRTEFKKGNVPPFKGKKLPKYIKIAISKANMGRKKSQEQIERMRASILKTWDRKGRREYKRYYHTTRTPEYKNWRKAVFERDNYTCRDCGKKGDYLEAHHIKSWAKYPKWRFVKSNGLTLCKICHNKIPKRVGKHILSD